MGRACPEPTGPCPHLPPHTSSPCPWPGIPWPERTLPSHTCPPRPPEESSSSSMQFPGLCPEAPVSRPGPPTNALCLAPKGPRPPPPQCPPNAHGCRSTSLLHTPGSPPRTADSAPLPFCPTQPPPLTGFQEPRLGWPETAQPVTPPFQAQPSQLPKAPSPKMTQRSGGPRGGPGPRTGQGKEEGWEPGGQEDPGLRKPCGDINSSHRLKDSSVPRPPRPCQPSALPALCLPLRRPNLRLPASPSPFLPEELQGERASPLSGLGLTPLPTVPCRLVEGPSDTEGPGPALAAHLPPPLLSRCPGQAGRPLQSHADLHLQCHGGLLLWLLQGRRDQPPGKGGRLSPPCRPLLRVAVGCFPLDGPSWRGSCRAF